MVQILSNLVDYLIPSKHLKGRFRAVCLSVSHTYQSSSHTRVTSSKLTLLEFDMNLGEAVEGSENPFLFQIQISANII